jgi:hypothetical protein
MADASDNAPLAVTPLHALHRAAGARMVPFAGYDMPVQYPDGIIAEHVHTREKAGLFDVSHMGQAFLSGANVIARFETLVPGDIAALAQGRIRYTQLLNSDGGILDDMMVTRLADDRLFLVVNAACKAQDFAHIARALPISSWKSSTHARCLRCKGRWLRQFSRNCCRAWNSCRLCRPRILCSMAQNSISRAPATRARTVTKFPFRVCKQKASRKNFSAMIA